MRYLPLTLILLLHSAHSTANSGYPQPKPSDERLFYLQRSTNSNTVIYDAHLTEGGQLDAEQPVEVYWRRYEERNQRKELNFLERHFAYGVRVDRGRGERYHLKLAALPERKGVLRFDPEGRPEVVTEIGGTTARLRFIYVQVEEGGLWPSVDYVELHGETLAERQEVVERIDP